MLSLTKKEKIAVCFLVFCLVVGGAISLWSRHNPEKFVDLRVVPGNPPAPDSVVHHSTNKLDINSAGFQQLTSLPGIGPKLAQRILQYREKNGPFHTVTDLKKVEGIGDKNLARLVRLIEVREK